MAKMEGEFKDEIVDLNVGGTFYTTTISTLTKTESMLSLMFSGNFSMKKRKEDERFFIDRDGEMFKFILQYLRDGDLGIQFMDPLTKDRLKREATYYCIDQLVDKLNGREFIDPTNSKEKIIDSVHTFLTYRSDAGFFMLHSESDPFHFSKVIEKEEGGRGTAEAKLIALYADKGFRLLQIIPKDAKTTELVFQRSKFCKD
eukprot:TRINITY_DN3288_c0_g1_i3.p1 TRINITY_DN3288_c0_g1~~TRINITY_DN3288_c0_g1_i3.p1  ORF type:complete len:201 (+),score=55.67 TRINITY_DN3288_c0_g1_i3:100-702(+)